MAKQIIYEPSRTLQEFRLLPRLTTRENSIDNIDLSTNIPLSLRIPLISAAMQSVSGVKMAEALGNLGGLATIYCSQSIEDQAKMVYDSKKLTFQVSAAVNTHDYKDRAKTLFEAGADMLCIDASDGFSYYVHDCLNYLKDNFPNLPVMAGNVVDAEAFRYLVRSGATAVKVGLGSGSICITQEQKGIGRGLATALIDVCKARDEWVSYGCRYIPIIADGGIVTAKDMTMALAIGADAIMLGRYFAQMDESPTEKQLLHLVDGTKEVKPYWGEGSARAQEWKSGRYNQNKFVEGVEGYVDTLGKLEDNLPEILSKIKASMSSCGAQNLEEFRRTSILEVVSALSIKEGQPHDIIIIEK